MKNIRPTPAKTVTDFGTIIEIDSNFVIVECTDNNENILVKRKLHKSSNNRYIIVQGEKIFL